MMYNGSLHCRLRGDGDGCGISWIRDVDDAQNPQKMLLIDIQYLIVHIMGEFLNANALM
jgi:hypothetical protein